MRKIIMSLVASLVVASPALANEARIEARGGIFWVPGSSKGTAGVAAGYDMDVSPSVFVGGEVSADKVLTSGTRVAFGFSGRAGVKVADKMKFFAVGGYTTKPCQFCDGSAHIGAGGEYSLAKNVYAKLEYRRYFGRNGFSDSNAVVTGLGMRF